MNDDLISRQAFIDFMNCGHLVCPEEVFYSESDVLSLIKSRPSVDAVKVVRCKYCKWVHYNMRGYHCKKFDGMTRVTPDSFCSNGER